MAVEPHDGHPRAPAEELTSSTALDEQGQTESAGRTGRACRLDASAAAEADEASKSAAHSSTDPTAKPDGACAAGSDLPTPLDVDEAWLRSFCESVVKRFDGVPAEPFALSLCELYALRAPRTRDRQSTAP